jgi:hypothetical protein
VTALQTDIEDLASSDTEISWRAKQRLLSLGSAALGPLLDALESAELPLRWKVLLLLYEIGDSRAVPAIIHCLQSPSPAIRAAAAQLLGKSGDKRAATVLRESLTNDQQAESLVWIIQALGALKDPLSVDPLIRVMQQTDSSAIRYTAIEALGLIGDTRAIEPICQFSEDTSHHVRARVSTALERLQTVYPG